MARHDDSLAIEIGRVEAIFRYPVKSMRGEALDAAALGWHGLDGDRRLGLRRLEERGGFPWLTAGKLADLVRFTPVRRPNGADGADGDLPTHIRTPDGEELPLYSEALAADIARRSRMAVEMTHLKHGIFDDASVSVITSTTVGEVCRLAGRDADVRRFRPNIVLRSTSAVPFEEDGWLGGVLTFGAAPDAPAVTLIRRDVRCAMINIDPDDASLAPAMMKAAVQANENVAGCYGTVTRIGRVAVGQPVLLHR
jgi:uncharacterized protein YcbX